MDSLLRFYEVAARLKTLKRAGWGRCGARECESVAEHSFGVALLAMFLPPKNPGTGIDRERCVMLALVHDLAETIVGDITPHDGVDPAEKQRREDEAIVELTKLLEDEELLELWREFEAGETEEAQFVRQLDVIEMAWQARNYQKSGKLAAADAERFIESARSRATSHWAHRLIDNIVAS